MRHSSNLVFEGGSISVKTSGHGERDGEGELTLDERGVTTIPYEDREGCCLSVSLPKSELIAIRDFLNETFPKEK